MDVINIKVERLSLRLTTKGSNLNPDELVGRNTSPSRSSSMEILVAVGVTENEHPIGVALLRAGVIGDPHPFIKLIPEEAIKLVRSMTLKAGEPDNLRAGAGTLGYPDAASIVRLAFDEHLLG